MRKKLLFFHRLRVIILLSQIFFVYLQKIMKGDMKQRILLLIVVGAIALQMVANPIDRGEARVVAQEFIGVNDDTDDNVPVAPYYVFSRGEGKGYVIVSGDDSTTPIIGYTDEGDFDEAQLPQTLKDLLANWARKIGQVQANPQPARPRLAVRNRLLAAQRGIEGFKANWQTVNPLIQTHWHQSSPYNDICPTNPDGGGRAVTGCVATAASQIVYYFRRDVPDTLMYDTPKYSYGFPVTTSLPRGTFINYSIIKLSGHGSAAQDEAVAKLMFAVGTSSWLTYGNSTAGQPDEAGRALRNQFLLASDYVGKWDYGQTAWERLVYQSLLSGSPMLYGGTNYDSAGNANGHAVVLDGYDSKTGLYHFNFGWGGQGDGWYTIDDETGMNGFNKDQRGCLNFRPARPNIEAKIEDARLYQSTESNIKVTFTNHGTIPYAQGVKLFANTKASLSSKESVNITDAMPVNEQRELTFKYKPSRAQKTWLFICDAYNRILDSCSVEVLPSVADIHVKSFTVDAGGEETVIDGMAFKTVNNTTANVTMQFVNGENGTYCQPTLRCFLEKYNTDSKEWSKVTNKYITALPIEENDNKEVVFSFDKLQPETYYRAYMDEVAHSVSEGGVNFDTQDTVVYFTVRPSDLAVEVNGRSAVVTGTWNDALFVKMLNDSSVCSYDMTEVKDMVHQPELANPNAVIYTSYEIPGATNVVVNGVCDNLIINTAYEFHAEQPFTARKAQLILANAETGLWHDAVIPFAAHVPYGMQVKVPGEINNSVRYVTWNYADEMETNTIFMYLPDRDGLNTISAENVAVSTDTIATAFEGNMIASTYKRDIDENTMILGDKTGLSYYLPVEGAMCLNSFTPVLTFYYKNGYRTWKATAEYHVDIYYRRLTEKINQAYQAIEQYGDKVQDAALSDFMTALKHAEDVFTYRQGETEEEVSAENDALKAAIDQFMNAVADGIDVSLADETAQKPVEYYNLSGQRLLKPVRGVVIEKRGNTTKKIYIK